MMKRSSHKKPSIKSLSAHAIRTNLVSKLMVVLFVVTFWFTQGLAFESGKLSRLSSKYHSLSNTVLEGKGYYYVDYIIVRFQLNWYWSGHEDYNSHAKIMHGEQGGECIHREKNCSNMEEEDLDSNQTVIPWDYWEFNETADWDLVEKLEFFAHNQTFYEHEFFDNSSGIRDYPLGKGVDTNVFVTIFMTYSNHGPVCINVSLSHNGIKENDTIYDLANKPRGVNVTLTGEGDIGDTWGLHVEILDSHEPLIFNATILSMVGITTGAEAGGDFPPTIIPPSTEPDFTISISLKDKYEVFAGAQIFFIPCADRGFPNSEMDPKSGRCLMPSKGMWFWWWIIIGAAGLVLLTIIIAIIIAVCCICRRRIKPYVYVPPNTMPICPVVVMCDGNTNEDPNDHLLRERKMELQREADVLAEQQERERIIQMVREKNMDDTHGRSSPSAKTEFNAGADGGSNPSVRFSPSPTGGQSNPNVRFSPSPTSGQSNPSGRFSPSPTDGQYNPGYYSLGPTGFSGKK